MAMIDTLVVIVRMPGNQVVRIAGVDVHGQGSVIVAA